jgi:AraC-like DNA-binding protein
LRGIAVSRSILRFSDDAALADRLFAPFDLAGAPGLVEPRFERAVEAEDHEPAFAGKGPNPVVLISGGCFRAEEDNPGSWTFKQLAIEWGFLHMGHFSRNYRDLFGETPSETLMRDTSACGSSFSPTLARGGWIASRDIAHHGAAAIHADLFNDLA